MPSPRVAEIVWPWRQAAHPPVGNPAAAHGVSRGRVLLEVGLMAAAALTLKFAFHKVVAPWIVGGLAAFVLVTGLAVPAAYRKFHQGLRWLGKTTAGGLTWLLLVPFFYICFPIGRLLFSLRGYDPLHGAYDKSAPTYWVPHRRAESPERYRQQF